MQINVLMCGGRRTGKTSIMAAIESNVQEMFPKGDIILDMENTKDLVSFRKKQRTLFGAEYDGGDVAKPRGITVFVWIVFEKSQIKTGFKFY